MAVRKIKKKAIRDMYMQDYGISAEEWFSAVEECKTVRNADQLDILEAAMSIEPSIAAALFANLTIGVGYDVISRTFVIPMQRKDFQGYRRATIAKYIDMRRARSKQKEVIESSIPILENEKWVLFGQIEAAYERIGEIKELLKKLKEDENGKNKKSG